MMLIVIAILLALILIQITRVGNHICRNQVKAAQIESKWFEAINKKLGS